MKLISVIIPVYNREKYIKDSIQSVVDQTLPKGYSMEIIVIDDGSTDNTANIVKSLGERVKYRRIENSGLPAIPRNVGLRMAKGELIAFQDSDDLWSKNKLTKQSSVLENPDIVLSYGNAEIINETGEHEGTILRKGQAASGSIFDKLLETNFISTLTVMARKQILLEAGGFNESRKLRGVEDYEFWLRVSLMGKIQYIDSVLALYRTHSENISPKDAYTSYIQLSHVYENLIGTKLLDRRQKKLARNKLVSIYMALNKQGGRNTKLLKTKILYQKSRGKFS